MRTIEALPEDLSTLGSAGLREAIDARQERMDELFERGESGGTVTAADVTEAKSINGELDRLHEEGNRVLPHPGHPRPRGSLNPNSGRQVNGPDFGRLPSLGQPWVQKFYAAIDGTTGGGTLPGYFFDPQIRDLPSRRLFIRSLIPTNTNVQSDKVDYIQQTVRTNNAAPVAAGALKPTSVMTVARKESPIQVIGHMSEAIDRSILMDSSSLSTFIDGQMRLGVMLAEEDQIINGSGTPPALRGILNTSGIQTQAKGADPTPDTVHKAITKIRTNAFVEPDAVVFHPLDWEEVALLRTADGLYIWNNPADDTPPKIWGLPVVLTTAIAQGTALVGAFGVGTEVDEREGARVTFQETGLNEGGNDMFSRNQVRFRGESRIGLRVYRPDGFCTCTGV